MESIYHEGETVSVKGMLVSVNTLDNTSMVQIESEDARAILKIKNDNIVRLEDDDLK